MSKDNKENVEGTPQEQEEFNYIVSLENVINDFSKKISIANIIAGLRIVEHNVLNNTISSLDEEGKE